MTAASRAEPNRPFTVFIVVAEESGDQLGFRLMKALTELKHGDVRFVGTGGSRMEAEGLDPLLRPGEVDLIGFTGLFSRLPHIFARIRQIADAAIAAEPDVLVLVDSPEFSHRVARIVRKERPQIPVINYVSPSVWAWRAARAKGMLPYVDHVLALLPFEPAVYRAARRTALHLCRPSAAREGCRCCARRRANASRWRRWSGPVCWSCPAAATPRSSG